MDENSYYFEKIDKILDREVEHLLAGQREHHSSWDNHILTLSTAAIGFSFTILSPAQAENLCLFQLGIAAFVLAIASAMANYIFSERGFNIVTHGNIQRRTQHNEARRRIQKLLKEVNEIGSNGDPQAIRRAQERCDIDVDAIYRKHDSAAEIQKMEANNRIISMLNYGKTLFFLAGIILISVYTTNNIEAVGLEKKPARNAEIKGIDKISESSTASQ